MRKRITAVIFTLAALAAPVITTVTTVTTAPPAVAGSATMFHT